MINYIPPIHTQESHLDFAQRISFLFTGYYNFYLFNETTLPLKYSLSYMAREKELLYAEWNFKFFSNEYKIDNFTINYFINGPQSLDKNGLKGLDSFKFYGIKTGLDLLNEHFIKYGMLFYIKKINKLYGKIYLFFTLSKKLITEKIKLIEK